MKYIIGITVYNEWHLLWETHIGLDKNMELCYSVWGPTEDLTKTKAAFFVDFLNENLKEYLQNLS